MTTKVERLDGIMGAMSARWLDDVRFDTVFTTLCGWILAGAFMDGWAHSHGRTDDWPPASPAGV